MEFSIPIEDVKKLCKMLELAKNEPYCIASKERHSIFGNSAKRILVIGDD